MSQAFQFSETDLYEIAYDLRANREIALKRTYQIPDGAKRWSDIERRDNFAKDAERNLMRHFAQLLARQSYGSDTIQRDTDGVMRTHVVDFGSGSGETTRAFLCELHEQGITPVYHPVDISQSLLQQCVQTVRQGVPDLIVEPHELDFDRRDLVFELLREMQQRMLQAHGRRNIIGLFLGNTIGNGDARSLLKNIAGSLDVADKLIVGAHQVAVHNDECIDQLEHAYQADEAIHFGFTALEHLNVDRNDGLVSAKWNAHAHAIEYHFMPHRDLSITVGNQTVELRKNRPILFAKSAKFGPAGLTQLISEYPLDINVMQISPDHAQIQTMMTRRPG